MDVVRIGLQLVSFVAGPCLATLALRGWAKRLRFELQGWRKVAGLTSTAIAGLNWLAIIYVGSAAIGGWRAAQTLLEGPFSEVIGVSSVAALLMSLALKGPTRIQVAGASALVLAFLLSSVIS